MIGDPWTVAPEETGSGVARALGDQDELRRGR